MNLKINKFYKSIFGENLSGNSITTIYGPPAIGKSNLCFEFIVETLKLDKKVMVSKSKKPCMNLDQPYLDLPYLRGRCFTTFSPILLKPAFLTKIGIYRCMSP